MAVLPSSVTNLGIKDRVAAILAYGEMTGAEKGTSCACPIASELKD
ncbi:MAG TPA: hypothetical protein VF226_16680 [Hyphomicrobiaceae bacterium]